MGGGCQRNEREHVCQQGGGVGLLFGMVGCFHRQWSPGGYGPWGTEYPEPVVSQLSKLTLLSQSYRQLQEEVPQDRTVDAGQG